MDNTAIEAIAALAHAERTNATLAANPNVESRQVVLPAGYTLIDTERYEQNPTLFRGTFRTQSIGEFADYVKENINSNTGLFINPEKGTALAILDMGSAVYPKWGLHRAELSLKKTSEYANLLNMAGKPFSQQGMIDFIEDWGDCIAFKAGDDTHMATSAAIQAIRKMTVSTVGESVSEIGDFSVVHSATDRIEMKAQGGMPKKFRYAFEPYEGFDGRGIDCILHATTDGKDVTLKYRIVALERAQDSIGQEFKELLDDRIGLTAIGDHKTRIYSGDFEHQKSK